MEGTTLLTTLKLLVVVAGHNGKQFTLIFVILFPCMVVNNKHRVDLQSVTKVMLQFTDYNMKKILA